jgi:hypothetical protein
MPSCCAFCGTNSVEDEEMKNFYILSALLSAFLFYFIWQWMDDSKQVNLQNAIANRHQVEQQQQQSKKH